MDTQNPLRHADDDAWEVTLWALLRGAPGPQRADWEALLKIWPARRGAGGDLAGFLAAEGVVAADAPPRLAELRRCGAAVEPDRLVLGNAALGGPCVLFDSLFAAGEGSAAPSGLPSNSPPGSHRVPAVGGPSWILTDLGFHGRLARLDAAALALPAAVFVDRLTPAAESDASESDAAESDAAESHTSGPNSAEPVAAEPVVPIEDAARLPATPDGVESGAPLRAGERPAVGRRMGKCLLTELVGRGGSAMVFRALHTTLRIPVAVKVLLLDQIERDRRVLELLGEEAVLLARLNHPNIVRVLDFEGDATYPYLVLEFVEGLSLADLISQSGRLRPDRAVGIMRQVCAGLAEARRLGVVHRDIKPANILVARDGAAKIVDLGLAVIVGAGPSNKSSSAAGLDVLAGTVAYMAPEQSLGETDLDHRCDIYSLGATFYHAVTGQVPFRGRTMLEVMRKHAQEPVPLAHLVAPDVPPGFSEVIARMMAKQPTERYADYAELDAALAGLVGKPQADRPAAGDRPAGVSGGEPSLSGSRRSWRSLLGSLFRRPGEAFSDQSGSPQTGASHTGGTQTGGSRP